MTYHSPSSETDRHEDLLKQVELVERSFAQTMESRDFETFKSFVADGAIFISDQQTLRGKSEVLSVWNTYFQEEAAPFSWEPEQVEVLSTEGQAVSTGPVFNPNGELIARYLSIWKRNADGKWRVIFDKGFAACE